MNDRRWYVAALVILGAGLPLTAQAQWDPYNSTGMYSDETSNQSDDGIYTVTWWLHTYSTSYEVEIVSAHLSTRTNSIGNWTSIGLPAVPTEVNNDSNIAHIGVPTRSLSYRIGPAKYKLRFDDNALYVTMEIASRSRTTTHGLLTLSPSFALDSTLPKNTAERIRTGLLWLAAAVVVYFSAFQSQVPLLAPFLAIVGFSRLLHGMSFFFRGKRTVILSNSGEYMEEIPHDLVSDNERKEFLASLEAAINAYHDEWRRRIIT